MAGWRRELAGCRSSLSMSKIQVKISETKFLSCYCYCTKFIWGVKSSNCSTQCSTAKATSLHSTPRVVPASKYPWITMEKLFLYSMSLFQNEIDTWKKYGQILISRVINLYWSLIFRSCFTNYFCIPITSGSTWCP